MLDDVLKKGEVEAYEYKTVGTPSTKQESRMQTLPSLTTIFVTPPPNFIPQERTDILSGFLSNKARTSYIVSTSYAVEAVHNIYNDNLIYVGFITLMHFHKLYSLSLSLSISVPRSLLTSVPYFFFAFPLFSQILGWGDIFPNALFPSPWIGLC